MNKFFNDTKYAISWGILGLLLVSLLTSAFLLAKTSQVLDNDGDFPNTISVTGVGEVVSVPDVATFSFSVVEKSESVTSAQSLATEKTNKILAFLEDSEIDENDLKTTSYNIYPKYEWIQPICITEINCPRGENKLVGYEVSQSVRVKVRDTQKAGDILSGIGSFEVSNVSGLNFEIDDEDSLKEEARSIAIKDAKEKAEKLAKDLGVDLEEIIGFSEDFGYEQPMYRSYAETADFGFGGEMNSSPQLPTGENTIKRTVYITYEIEG